MSANMIINFFKNYGLIMTLLATSGIVFVGALKSVGLFSKLNPKIKKYVYFISSCITSIISCTLYLYIIDAFVWADWGMTIACVIGFTISIYGVYENTGFRTLLKKLFFTPIKNLIKSIPNIVISKSMTEEKILLLAKNLGSDILLQIANETRQKEIASDIAGNGAIDNNKKQEVKNTKFEANNENEQVENNDEYHKNQFFS